MKLLLTIPLVLTGCMSSNKTIDEFIPEKTLHIPANVAEKKGKEDGSKGKFPPGRTINYKGHGVDYTTGNGHINHHIHKHTHHGHGGLGYHHE